MRRLLVLSLTQAAALALLLPHAWAQPPGGAIYGTVTDESGDTMPGASVKLQTPVGTHETVADIRGNFRFVSLDQGRYTVTVSLVGFTTVERRVSVNSGESTNAPFQLKVAPAPQGRDRGRAVGSSGQVTASR
jgi:hypothetical protein